VLDRAGDRTRALDILRELARANPSNRETMDAWLRLEAEVGDRTGAVAMRRRLYRDAPAFRANAVALAAMLLDNPGDLALMVDDDGKRKFTIEQLQGMTPLKRQQELQQAAQANANLGLDIVRLLQKSAPGDATLALVKARALARFGKPKDGEDSLRADIAATPAEERRMLWIALGAFLAESGFPERAAEPFAEAIKLQDPKTRDAELQVADFWFSKQQWQRAREALEPVVAGRPGPPPAATQAMRLAEVCQNVRDYDAATRYADVAEKELGKTNVTIEMLRGGTMVGRGDAAVLAGDVAKGEAAFLKAIESFRKATELAPNNPVAWASLAEAERGMYLRSRDPARLSAAETAVDRALAILSTYPQGLRIKKDILMDRNDLDGAITMIERYLRSSPQSQDGRRLLVDLLMRAGKSTRAIAIAEEGAQQEPRNAEWPTTIGNIHFSLAQEKEASAAFERAFATDSTEETLIRATNSHILRKEPDWSGAVDLLRANPRLVADSVSLQALLGSALVNAKQRDAGLQALRNTFNSIRDGIERKTLPPDSWDTWYAAVGQAFTGRPTEAEAFVKSVLGGKPMDFYADRGLARVWQGAGKDGLPTALKYMADAVAQAKDRPDLASSAAIEAGSMAYLGGNCEQSLPLFEQAITLQPNFPPALNNAAFTTAKCGTALDKALAWSRKAVEMAPQVSDFQDTLGFVLIKAGKASDALGPLQRAVTLTPTAGSPLVHLAEALALTGRKDEARATLERTRPLKLNAEQAADADRVAKMLQ
jgi:tetratricopeptide (TPR) repeat protein